MPRLQTTASLVGCMILSAFSAMAASGAEPSAVTAIGAKLSATTALRDLHGNRRGLADFGGNKALVLVFLGAECPVSNVYAPALVEMEKRLRPKQVQFLAIYANESEDLDQIASHVLEHNLPFPVLKDFGQRLADSLGIVRVPSVAILDNEAVLRYRGRIDDQYGVSSRRAKATRADLSAAIEEVLEGKKTTVAETEADGCLLERGRKSAPRADVTYAKHVAPILQNRCQRCHRPDQTAPFALMNYEDAAKHAAMIKEVTSQRRMPPWQADPRYGHWRNDRRLTRDEIDMLAAWVENGTPRGDDKDLPKPITWPRGWAHGTPDMVISMPEEFSVPASGVVPYKNWIIDPNFTEDKWVRIAEARPGSPGVIHHIVVYILRPGQRGPNLNDGGLAILVGWAPGDLGLVCPPDTALRVPKGSRLRFEMHYTPNGTAVKDRSTVGLTFAKEPPKHEMLLHEFANMAFEVPPYDPHYKAEASFRLRADARILSFAPHMHWRGKDYRYEVIYPDGRRETLLSVPRWDFNWQNVYRFQEPLKLPKGARLHAVAHWDNSAANPLNPDPSKKVVFGLQSWEEMMVGFVAFVWERPKTAAELAKNPLSMADQFFDRLDVNGDDFITPDEIPDRARPFLMAAGVKISDKISREEFTKLFEEARKRFPQGRPDLGRRRDVEKKPEPPAKEEKKPAPKPPVGGNHEVETIKDLAYVEGPDADPAKHKLDLYLPKGHKDFPVLFFVHGGGWKSGDRKLYLLIGQTFAKNGVGTVVISYRLSPNVQHPAHIQDVAKAFAWTVRNIAKYGGDPEQIFVSGHSAGGHLSALLVTDESYLKAEGLSRANIKAALPLSGVYKFRASERMASILGKDEETVRNASPLTHVKEGLPPFLIVYADKDFATCDKMSEDFCQAIQKCKCEASTLKINDRTHISIIVQLMRSSTDPATVAMLEFIAKHSGREFNKGQPKS